MTRYKPIKCVMCGDVTERTAPSQTYCKPCSLIRKRERNRKWMHEHPECGRKAVLAYHYRNRDRELERMKQWYRDNIEPRRVYRRKYIDENLDKFRMYAHNRKARKRGNGGGYTEEELSALFIEQDGVCPYCGKLLYASFEDQPSVDHMVPLSRGGRNDIANIALAHLSCNLKKRTKTPEEFFKAHNG